MIEPNQIYVFLVCVTCGVAGGFVYDIFYCARYPFGKSWVRIVTDVVFCIFFAVLYLFVSVMMGLPGIRLYTFLGCLLGLFLYLKSFHKIVAFFTEKVYNSIKRMKKERKPCPQKKKRLCLRKNKNVSSLQ